VKIVHFSTSDGVGGAARAAYRLHKGLLRLKQDSILSVQTRESDDPTVVGLNLSGSTVDRLRRRWRRTVIRKQARELAGQHRAGGSYFSDDRSEHLADALRQAPACDVLNLHWVSGFLDIQTFFSSVPKSRPIVWTLHDMNAFTGGCHYDAGCGRFACRCGACPQLNSGNEQDFSRQSWNRKRAAYGSRNSKLHLVTPSKWLAGEAQRSGLLSSVPVTVIPNGLDTEVFQPRDQKMARDLLGIPFDSQVILFLADWLGESRKGFGLLRQALERIPDKSRLTLLTIGRGATGEAFKFPTFKMEYLDNDRFLSLVYSAADIFLLPTLQDNLPNTAVEALSCGVPVVAFDVGGLPEIIRDGVEGRLVPAGDIPAFADAIWRTLGHPETLAQMKVNARQRAVQEYEVELSAQRYVDLYQSLI
jgi:glycosyltransferase involved in cell wall biosynthesis